MDGEHEKKTLLDLDLASKNVSREFTSTSESSLQPHAFLANTVTPGLE